MQAARPEKQWPLILWFSLMTVGCSIICWRIASGWAIETDVRSLLPSEGAQSETRFQLELRQNRQMREAALLIGGRNESELAAAINAAQQSLQDSHVYDLMHGGAISDHVGQFYSAHAAYLLSARDRDLLSRGRSNEILQRSMSRLFSFSSVASRTDFSIDPLGLLSGFLEELPLHTVFVPEGDSLCREHDGVRWCLLPLTARGEAFGLDLAASQVEALDAAIARAQAVSPGVIALDSGVARHAYFAATRARSEMSLIGGFSALTIMLLLSFLLRSPWALVGAILPFAAGALCGLASCALFWSDLHLVGLVFGASLLGVAVDYVLHYLLAPGDGIARVERIGAPMLIGLMTSCLAFLALLLAPYSGLRQVAVFAIAGLAGAGATVLIVLPRLPERCQGEARFVSLGNFAMPVRGRARRVWLAVLFALLALGLPALFGLQSGENIRAMYQGSEQLLEREQQARALIGGLDAAQYFVVHAPTADALLEINRRLLDDLAPLTRDGVLRDAMSIAEAMPTVAQQVSDHKLMADSIYGADGILEKLADHLGFPKEWVIAQRKSFNEQLPLSWSDWLGSSASQPYERLMLDTKQGMSNVVVLGGVTDAATLGDVAARLKLEGFSVEWQDPLAQAQGALEGARKSASRAFIGTLALVFMLLVLKTGFYRALTLMLPGALALFGCLVALGYSGQPFTLFHLFALILVLGLSVDYTIFLQHAKTVDASSLIAVIASAFTTVMSFGLLSLSGTPALQAFGKTVLIGISLALVSTLVLYRYGLADFDSPVGT